MKLRSLAVPLVVLAVTFAVAGCGSGSDSTTGGSDTAGTEVPPTTAGFLKQGSAICAKGIAEIQKGFETFAKKEGIEKGKGPDKAQQTEVIETILIPGIAKQVEAIEALDVPATQEEAVKDFVKRVEAELESAEENPTLLTTGVSFEKAREEAQQIGLNGCPAG